MPELQFDSFNDFIAMGGYGVYVWAAYGFFFLVVAFNLWQPLMARRKIMKQRLNREKIQRERARGPEGGHVPPAGPAQPRTGAHRETRKNVSAT